MSEELNTSFNEYLMHLKEYEKESHTRLLENSAECVAKALTGDIEALVDIFKNFPLDYSTAAKHEYYSAATDVEKKHWLKEYEQLIQRGNFHKVNVNGELNVIAGSTTKEKIEQLNMDILITACVDLLDNEGHLKPEIVQFFHLGKIFDANRFTPDEMEKATEEILYSYYNHIVLVNLDMIEINRDCDVDQLDCLHGFSTALFLDRNNFTTFFKDTVANYRNLLLKSDFITYLKNYFTERQEKFSLFTDAVPLTGSDIYSKAKVNLTDDSNPNPLPPLTHKDDRD